MNHITALHLARIGKFDNLSYDLLHAPVYSDKDWRGKIVTLQSIELYKHFYGMPNDFQSFTKMCQEKGFENQQAAVLNNLALMYPCDAVDLLTEAETLCHLPENLTIIKLNKALYLDDYGYLQAILPECKTPYTTAQAMIIGGVLLKNETILHWGIDLLFKMSYISDIMWVKMELDRHGMHANYLT